MPIRETVEQISKAEKRMPDFDVKDIPAETKSAKVDKKGKA